MTADVDNPYDGVASPYRAVRPGYLPEVFTALESYADVDGLPRVLEVGAGTGQATRHMATLGWVIDAIEPGCQLAAELRADSNAGPVRIRNARFEDAIVEPSSFDLVIAATSWHWIDPAVGYRKAWAALRPHGVIGLIWNAHVPDTIRPDWDPIRRAYLDVAPELADLARLTPDRADYDPASELAHSGYFDDVAQRVWPFEVSYSAFEFLALIGTYASHRVLDAQHRRRLDKLLRSVIDDLGGYVTKPYEALLVLGRRRPSGTAPICRWPIRPESAKIATEQD
ncbi:class I SAM-dependent methyltransferase [soil metagenome]